MMLSLLMQATIALAASAPLTGSWRAVLDLAGGELPFGLTITQADSGWRGRLTYAHQSGSISAVRVKGDSVVLEMADYDAAIAAAVRGDSLTGYYHNVGSNGPRTIPFRAARGRRPIVNAPDALLGRWDVTYYQEGGTSPRIFDFRNEPYGFQGSIISSTSDYGPFYGEVVSDSFAIGLFDGSFVYLLTGKLDGDTLRGIFHAGLRTQTPWKGVRSTGPTHLKSPSGITHADTTKPFQFAFPDLQGRMVRNEDRRFKGKVVLVDIFGSWCPTCHEGTPELLRLYRRYHRQGLEIVGLAYEVTGDTAIDARQVRRYRDKFSIPFPLLLAGTNDNETVEGSLPQLRGFSAYPTTLLLGRDGRVRRVHAGFYSGRSGEFFSSQFLEFDREIQRLLKEKKVSAS
jgi:thiol-disulfide isomerase/thioredoxin